MSANLPLPKKVFAHGFFTVEGKKVSKSLGNAIDPRELVAQYGLDALRYYLLREIPFGADGEFTQERFTAVYNSDLANELGNLVQRVAVMAERYMGGVLGDLPHHSHDVRPYEEAMKTYNLDNALAEVWLLVKGLNQYLEEEKPWQKAKSDPDGPTAVLQHAVSDLIQIATLLLPFMPNTAEKIIATFADGKVHGEIGILFPKADTIERTTF
jgi:methionyl-tRNA synthetase